MRHLFFALFLPACTAVPWKPADPDCASFDALVVTDPDGVATETDRGRVNRALASFAAWSAADGVCVDEVRFVPDGTCGPDADEGCWEGAGEPILVEEDVGSDTARALLCRALVASPAFTADPYEEFDTESWFAWACSKGPAELRLFDVAADACPWLSVSRGQARFLLDEVYPRYDRSVLSEEPARVELLRRPLVGAEADVGGWVESGGWLYAFEGTAPEVESLVRVDPATLAVVARLPLPARVDYARRRLLATDGTPIVVYAEEVTRAVQPDDAMTTFAELDFPAFEEGSPVSGVVSGTTAWLGATQAGEATPTLVELDLATGATTTIDAPGLISIDSLRGDATRLVGVGWTNSDEEGPTAVLLEVDPAARAVTLTPFPYEWRIWDVVGAADGAVAAWSVDDHTSVARYDGAAWHLAADACGTDRLAASYDAAVLGGDALFWEEPDADERIEPGPWLTLVDVE